VASVWPLYHKGLIDAEMVDLLKGSPVSTKELWSSVIVTIRFLVISLTKALLPRLLSLTTMPALGRVLVFTNFFHFKNDGGNCVFGDLQFSLPQVDSNQVVETSQG
jgi:hypothetical protein